MFKWDNPPTCILKFALYISRPFLRVDHCVNSVNINFTLNLTQGVFIDRIYGINHTETWHFNIPTLVTFISHKITAKCGILCPKTPLSTEKQLYAIHFFVATRNVCPLAIPESWAQKMGLRLLKNHSFGNCSPFSPKSPTPKGSLCHFIETLLTIWQLFAIFAKISTFKKVPVPCILKLC